MRFFSRLFAALACLILPFPALAAPANVGIVLLHGKWDKPPTHIAQLARSLEAQQPVKGSVKGSASQ